MHQRNNQLNTFKKLVDFFIQTGQIGDFNESNHSITLYDIQNSRRVIDQIKNDIQRYTSKYKVIVTDPNREYTNVKILDIEL